MLKKIFSKLLNRNIHVNILHETIKILTSHPSETFENIMEGCICVTANAINFDRVVIYSKMNDEQFGQFYRWSKEAGTMPINEMFRILPSIPVVQQWFSILSSRKNVVRRIDKMTKEEVNFADMIGIKSIILIPVFKHGKIWSIVSYQDHTNKRDFDEYFNLLSTLAYLYADMVTKEDIRRNQNKNIEMLEHNKKMSDVLNKTAIKFVSQDEGSFDARMTKGLMYICDMINLDRLSIWRNSSMPNGLHASQIYRWDRELGGTTKPTPGLHDVTYAKLAPRWEKVLPRNEIINGPIRLMPEAAMLNSFGVVSALVVPLIVKKAFWGFVLFEDRRNERYFDDDCIEMMRTTAFLCMNTVVRAEMESYILDVNKANSTLINEASIGIIIFDHANNMIDCNAKILEVFGCTKQYFLEHFKELSPEYQPDGANSVEKIDMSIKQMLSKGKTTFEWLHKSYSGELIPCEITLISANYMGNARGLGYLYDLRKIREIEVTANEAQKMAKALAEASPMAYILLDEEFKAIDCNKETMRIFACTDKQYLLDNYFERFSAEKQLDGEYSLEKIKIMRSKIYSQEKCSFEWSHKTFDDELFPTEITYSPFVFNDKKYVISFLYDLRNHKKMIADISEQTKLLALRLEQQKLVADISRSFVSYGDSYTLINDALDKLGNNLGVSRLFIFCVEYEHSETYVAYQWYKNYSIPKFRNNRNYDLFNMIKTMFPEKLQENVTVPVISHTDVTISSEKSIYILKFDDVVSCISVPLYVENNLWGIICAENCFESHEWSKDEISFLTTISNIIAGEITRSLYEIKLKETLDKVINLSMAKDNFLSKISHEIRTPMNAIMGITEIQLRDETISKERRDGLNIIYNSGDSLLRITNDLLDLSKLEAKKLEILPNKYKIASLISDITQLNIPRIENKPIKFKLSVDEKIPSELIGDELRIKQILNNILSNASKYTATGEILMSILVESYESEDYDVMLVFQVKDTGQGMTEEQANKIFDEYSRFNLGNNRSIEGTGLGMSITQNLVNLMNGEISVKSELGKGSAFTVCLPQKNVGDEVLGKEVSENLQNFRMINSQNEKMQFVRNQMPYGKVLVVDDVESNLYVAKHLLDPYDLSLETASNGLEAVEKIKNGKIYDIIFMDHMMPKMDGIEATKIIRNLGYKHPIIALTANAVVGQAEIFFENGFDGFISKPIDTRQLNNELNRFILDKQTSEVIAEAKEKSTQLTKTIQTAVDMNLLEVFVRDAKKSLPIFEKVLDNITDATDEDLYLFTIKSHAMKSAFANIGEDALSQIALTLEKAGKERDKNTIKALTLGLIDNLKKIVEKTEKSKKFIDVDENFAYLREQLKIIGDACVDYDAKTAEFVLAKLKEMLWTHETTDILEQISKYILLSEFEGASELAFGYGRKI